MKKLAASLLLVLYFAFSAGATVHLHYCMGEYAGFSFTDNYKNSCSKCGMDRHEKESDCCKDVQVTKKISDPHNFISAVFNTAVPCIEPPTFYLVADENPSAQIHTPVVRGNPPPGILLPLFLRNRNLRL
jgi:hypothetical protein